MWNYDQIQCIHTNGKPRESGLICGINHKNVPYINKMTTHFLKNFRKLVHHSMQLSKY